MFESDDFDQVLSQIDLPDVSPKLTLINCGDIQVNTDVLQNIPIKTINKENTTPVICDNISKNINNKKQNLEDKYILNNELLSSKNCKRKIIDSHFDSYCKRKFPGPAGLLSGSFKEYKDEDINHIELLSQDIDFAQNPLQRGLFDSKLWKKLLQDECNLKSVETIKTVKQLALNGNLKCRKAQTIAAFVESVDRTAMDPLVTLTDLTGNIKCTLHRDAWSYFSSYIIPAHTALVLCKPTVLTTGSAFKKHYLNITMSNILAIYSSAIVEDEDKPFPDGYEKVVNEDCTVIKMDKQGPDKINVSIDNLEDLDGMFSDEIF